MLAADRAHVALWDFMAQPLAWRELYRTAVMAERRAENEIAKKNARRQKMANMQAGRR